MGVKRIILYLPLALFALGCPMAVGQENLQQQAQAAVDAFNGLNGGYGYRFGTSTHTGTWELNTYSGTVTADLSAYSPLVAGSADTWLSVCVEPGINPPGQTDGAYGQLSFANHSTSTDGNTVYKLTLGAALLYKQFATGQLAGFNYESLNYSEGENLEYAIQLLMGSSNKTSWTGNAFLQYLNGIDSDHSHWMQTYDPGAYYDEIGYYGVFVVNSIDAYGYPSVKTRQQDFLYLVGYSQQPYEVIVPEPSSIILFAGGLAGIAFFYRRRKKLGIRNEE